MACNLCEKLKEVKDLSRPHVVRTCRQCGRELKLRNPGRHGIGLKVEKGDRIVMPAEFLALSANPLKGNGQFTAEGLKWFAELVFGVDLATKSYREDFLPALRLIMENNENFFKDAECLQGLDLNNPDNEEEMFRRLNANQKSVEWFGYMAAGMCHMAITSIEEGRAAEAAWATAVAERFRALAVFKSNFEEAVFMGHSARKLVELVRIWDANKDNSDEGFWQKMLTEHAYAISQLFSVPVTFIQERAYVGGKSFDRENARYLDFMFSGGSANDAILVEIKTPTSPLLRAKYRKNVYPPSKDLSGAVVQVNDYCDSLREDILRIKKDGLELNAFNPRRVVIIGNYARELTEQESGPRLSFFGPSRRYRHHHV